MNTHKQKNDLERKYFAIENKGSLEHQGINKLEPLKCVAATLPNAAPFNSSSLPTHFGGHSEKPQVVHVNP